MNQEKDYVNIYMSINTSKYFARHGERIGFKFSIQSTYKSRKFGIISIILDAAESSLASGVPLDANTIKIYKISSNNTFGEEVGMFVYSAIEDTTETLPEGFNRYIFRYNNPLRSSSTSVSIEQGNYWLTIAAGYGANDVISGIRSIGSTGTSQRSPTFNFVSYNANNELSLNSDDTEITFDTYKRKESRSNVTGQIIKTQIYNDSCIPVISFNLRPIIKTQSQVIEFPPVVVTPVPDPEPHEVQLVSNLSSELLLQHGIDYAYISPDQGFMFGTQKPLLIINGAIINDNSSEFTAGNSDGFTEVTNEYQSATDRLYQRNGPNDDIIIINQNGYGCIYTPDDANSSYYISNDSTNIKSLVQPLPTNRAILGWDGNVVSYVNNEILFRHRTGKYYKLKDNSQPTLYNQTTNDAQLGAIEASGFVMVSNTIYQNNRVPAYISNDSSIFVFTGDWSAETVNTSYPDLTDTIAPHFRMLNVALYRHTDDNYGLSQLTNSFSNHDFKVTQKVQLLTPSLTWIDTALTDAFNFTTAPETKDNYSRRFVFSPSYDNTLANNFGNPELINILNAPELTITTNIPVQSRVDPDTIVKLRPFVLDSEVLRAAPHDIYFDVASGVAKLTYPSSTYRDFSLTRVDGQNKGIIFQPLTDICVNMVRVAPDLPYGSNIYDTYPAPSINSMIKIYSGDFTHKTYIGDLRYKQTTMDTRLTKPESQGGASDIILTPQTALATKLGKHLTQAQLDEYVTVKQDLIFIRNRVDDLYQSDNDIRLDQGVQYLLEFHDISIVEMDLQPNYVDISGYVEPPYTFVYDNSQFQMSIPEVTPYKINYDRFRYDGEVNLDLSLGFNSDNAYLLIKTEIDNGNGNVIDISFDQDFIKHPLVVDLPFLTLLSNNGNIDYQVTIENQQRYSIWNVDENQNHAFGDISYNFIFHVNDSDTYGIPFKIVSYNRDTTTVDQIIKFNVSDPAGFILHNHFRKGTSVNFIMIDFLVSANADVDLEDLWLDNSGTFTFAMKLTGNNIGAITESQLTAIRFPLSDQTYTANGFKYKVNGIQGSGGISVYDTLFGIEVYEYINNLSTQQNMKTLVTTIGENQEITNTLGTIGQVQNILGRHFFDPVGQLLMDSPFYYISTPNVATTEDIFAFQMATIHSSETLSYNSCTISFTPKDPVMFLHIFTVKGGLLGRILETTTNKYLVTNAWVDKNDNSYKYNITIFNINKITDPGILTIKTVFVVNKSNKYNVPVIYRPILDNDIQTGFTKIEFPPFPYISLFNPYNFDLINLKVKQTSQNYLVDTSSFMLHTNNLTNLTDGRLLRGYSNDICNNKLPIVNLEYDFNPNFNKLYTSLPADTTNIYSIDTNNTDLIILNSSDVILTFNLADGILTNSYKITLSSNYLDRRLAANALTILTPEHKEYGDHFSSVHDNIAASRVIFGIVSGTEFTTTDPMELELKGNELVHTVSFEHNSQNNQRYGFKWLGPIRFDTYPSDQLNTDNLSNVKCYYRQGLTYKEHMYVFQDFIDYLPNITIDIQPGAVGGDDNVIAPPAGTGGNGDQSVA